MRRLVSAYDIRTCESSISQVHRPFYRDIFFLRSILWYLLKQFPFAFYLSFISARVDILNFYYVLSILFFVVIVVVGILGLRILRPCVTIDFQVFITINLLLIYFVNFEENINF